MDTKEVPQITDESVQLSNSEISLRVQRANSDHLRLDDYPENKIVVKKPVLGHQEYTVFLVPSTEETADRTTYSIDEGNLRLLSHSEESKAKGGRSFSKNLVELEDVQVRLETLRQNLQSQGIGLAFLYFRYDSPKKDKSGLPLQTEMAIYLAIGAHASETKLRDLLSWLRKEPDALEKHNLYLTQKEFAIIGLGNIGRDTYHARPIYTIPQVEINIPYSFEANITSSLAEINHTLTEMQLDGLLPKNAQAGPLNIFFAGKLREGAKPMNIPSNSDYQLAVKRLTDDLASEKVSGDPYIQAFHDDLSEIKFLSYDNAIKLTRFVPFIPEGDLVAKFEVCKVGRKKDGSYELLLGNKESDELFEFEGELRLGAHSYVDEHWQAKGRQNLLEEFDETGMVRGYFLQLTSGKKTLLLKMMSPQVINFLKPKYGVENIQKNSGTTNSSAFEDAVYLTQIERAIDTDVNLLKTAGISTDDINFYRYWARRFWVTKDMKPEAVYEDVEKKFKELETIIFQKKRKNYSQH